MAPHEISELKALLFTSARDVSDLLEEALKGFLNQKSSMGAVLDVLAGSMTKEMAENTTLALKTPPSARSSLNIAGASTLVLELKQQILDSVNESISAQSSPSSNQVVHLLS